MNAPRIPSTLGFVYCQMLAIAVPATTHHPQQLQPDKKKCYQEPKQMTETELALILFSIRELQTNIQYAPNQMLLALKNYYDVEIASPEDLFEALENLAQSLNCGDEIC